MPWNTQTFPKFVEEELDLEEEEQDEAMLRYGTFHQMCFPEEMKSTRRTRLFYSLIRSLPLNEGMARILEKGY